MASQDLYYLPQFFTTTLNVGGGITASQTTGITLQSVSGLDITKPGLALFTYSDPLDTTKAEWIPYTSINGSNVLQGVTRGGEGFTAKTHQNGATIAFPISKAHINYINDQFEVSGLDLKQISTPAVPSSGRNKLYFKTDGILYKENSSGVESPVEPVAAGITVMTDGATITIDHSINAKFSVVLGGNRTLALSNAVSGKPILLDLVQDGTGSRLVTWFGKGTTFTDANVNTTSDVITVAREIPTTTPIIFTNSGGAVPTGLTAGTVYYAINASTTTIKVATTVANAQAGTAVDITAAAGGGTHTITTQIRWAGGSAPTLTTGKNRKDTFGIMVADATNGVFHGYTVGQDL